MPKTRARARRQRICPWCFLSFSKEEHLSRHIRSHTKEKPFNCSVCGNSFTRHDSLLRHMRAHDITGKEDQTFGSATHPLETLTGTDQGSASLASLEINTNQLSRTGADNGTTTNILAPDQHDSASNSEGTLPVLNELFNPNVDELLEFNTNSQTPVWLADENFDLDAFNSSIMENTLGLFSPAYTANESSTDTALRIPIDTSCNYKEDRVRQHWFNYIGTHSNGQATPEATAENTELDERYRQNLFQRLQQRVPTEPLPSTDFLNLCVQLFFTRFHPVFPIVHAPTFRPSTKSSLLLLSICSIGSLFVGSKYAVTQGSIIFERLNKAILSSWEKYLLSGKSEAVAMTQAALIGQTFAMLSGKPRDILTLQTFHGTVTTWARLYKMFDASRATDRLSTILETHATEDAWRAWVRIEEQNRRVAAGLYILDTEISELVSTHPLMRYESHLLPRTARHDLWMAPNSTQWKKILTTSRSTPTSRFGTSSLSSNEINQVKFEPDGFQCYIRLESIGSHIMEQKLASFACNRQIEILEHFEPQLIQIFDQNVRANSEATNFEPYCLEVLWHSVFISLLVDISRLELALGREGHEGSIHHRDYLHTWSSSREAQRCALHGVLILRKLQAIPVGLEPAIHVPRAIYRAATVLYVYCEFGRDGNTSDILTGLDMNFPEISLLKMNGEALLFEANGYRKSKPKASESSTLCGLVDLLHRIGHWGLSRKFAEVFNILLEQSN